jgi:hypothetical protein
MLDLMFRIKINPLYIKDKIIQDRVNSRKRFRPLPAGLGYIAIFLLPMVFVALTLFHRHLLFNGHTVGFIRGCIIFSCYLQIIYFSYRALSDSFSLIVREREQKTFDSIIGTALSPRDILFGKFWMAFYPLAYELTFFFPLFLCAGLLTKIPFFKLFLVYLLTMGVIIFSVISSLWASAKGKNIQQAHTWSSSIIGGMVLGTFLLSLFISFICSMFTFVDMNFVNHIMCIPLFLNPFYSLSVVLFLDNICRAGEHLYYIICPLLSILLLYPVLTVWFWKNTLKQLSVVPEE